MIFNFFKPKLSKEFVDLSIGRIYFKEITNKIVNKVTNKATRGLGVINNNLYYQLMEFELLPVSRRKIDNLPLKEANIIREKVKKILLDNNLVTIEKETEPEKSGTDIFSDREVEWFEKTKIDGLNKLRTKNVRTKN